MGSLLDYPIKMLVENIARGKKAWHVQSMASKPKPEQVIVFNLPRPYHTSGYCYIYTPGEDDIWCVWTREIFDTLEDAEAECARRIAAKKAATDGEA